MEQGLKKLTGYCNGCANRCPVNSMQCGRGLKLMGLDKQAEQKLQSNLSSLLKACSNKLFISGGGEKFFDILPEEDKEKLKDYLSRLANQ